MSFFHCTNFEYSLDSSSSISESITVLQNLLSHTDSNKVRSHVEYALGEAYLMSPNRSLEASQQSIHYFNQSSIHGNPKGMRVMSQMYSVGFHGSSSVNFDEGLSMILERLSVKQEEV